MINQGGREAPTSHLPKPYSQGPGHAPALPP